MLVFARLLHALLASSVVAGAAAGASYGVTHWVPEGGARETVERYVTAPGREVYSRLREDPALRAELAKGAAKARKEARRLAHLYSVGSWAGIGFVICLAMTLLFGVKSIGAALALGFKVTLTMVFLQGALILGGLLALAKTAG